MPYKDARRQREYQRNWQRERRSQVQQGSVELTRELKLETLEDLRLVLEQIVGEVLGAELDLGVKGRVIAQLLTVGVRLFEKTELEARIEALEMQLKKDSTKDALAHHPN